MPTPRNRHRGVILFKSFLLQNACITLKQNRLCFYAKSFPGRQCLIVHIQIVEAKQADPNTIIRIFEPKSKPQLCGTQVIVNGQAVALGDSTGPPVEPYIAQPAYPAVTAGCPYTRCIAGGIPAVTLTVTAETHNATGHVESEPAGISLSGAGTSANVFPKDSHSLPPHPRVGYPCSRTEGQSCAGIIPGQLYKQRSCSRAIPESAKIAQKSPTRGTAQSLANCPDTALGSRDSSEGIDGYSEVAKRRSGVVTALRHLPARQRCLQIKARRVATNSLGRSQFIR